MAVNMGNAVGYLDLDIAAFTTALAEAQQAANSGARAIQQSFENASKQIDAIGKSISKVGKTLTVGITTPITAGFGAAIKILSEFEQTMSRVEALSGATGDELEALSEKAQEMGATTKFSANDAAEAFTYMAQAGWRTQAMLEGIDGVMNLAAADGIALADASSIVTSSLTGFGLAASDAARFADVLAVAASASNTDVISLGESFKYVAPVAGAAGYSIEDVATALGVMSNNGIVAGQAGTSLRAIISRLAAPTKLSAQYMEELGINISNADGTMKSFDEVIGILRDSFSGLTEAEQMYYAAEIFGQEAMTGVLALINTSVDSYNELRDAVIDSDGAAQAMAATMQDNLLGQLEELKSALEQVAINVGQVLMPYIKQLVAVLQGWATALADLDEEQTEMIVKIAAAIAVIGPAVIIVGKLVSGFAGLVSIIGKVTTGFSIISAATAAITAPILAVIAVIGTLVAAIANLWQNSETFRQAITTSWNKFKDDVTKVFSQITDGLNELGINWETIFNALKAVWDGFCQALAPVFTTAWSVILEVFSTVIETISNVFSIFASAFQGDWQGVWNSILKLFYDIGSGIWNVGKSIFDGISQVWNNFIGPFQSAWEKAWNGISSFFTNLMNAILDGFSKVVNWVLDAVGGLAGGVGAFLDFLGIEAGAKLMEWADKVKNTEVDVAVATADFIDRVGTTIETGMSEANDFFTKGWDEISGNVETTDIEDAVEDSMDGVIATIEGKSEEAAQAAGDELAKVPRVVAQAVGASSAEVESMLGDYSVEGLDILTTLANQLAMVDSSQAALGEEFDATAAKMEAYQQAIQALNDLGFSESSELIVTLRATLEGLGVTLDDTAEDTETNQQKILNAFEQSIASINANADAMAELGREYDKDGELVQLYRSTLNDLLSLPVEERFEGWSDAVAQMTKALDELNANTESNNFLDNLAQKNQEWYNDTGKYISQVEGMYTEMSGYVMDITGAVFDYINQGYENQINELQEQIDTNNEMYEQQIQDEKDRYNRELANLKELYANKEISDEEYRAQKNALEQQMTDFVKQKNDEKAASEAELKRQQNELARKQFESNKATQIAEVWINAAAATMRAFAENWWPVALGIAAAIATIAGVQTAAIASQQFVPMYAKGGIVDKPTLGIFGEAGKEAIVPLERNTEWMDILEDRMMKAIGGAANAGYNIVFNSPKAIDAREASRLMKRTVRDLAEGF